MNNLALKVFKVLRNLFADENGEPIHFSLRDKVNTQDDPFDEYIANKLDEALRTAGIRCQKSSGPLISPDMAVYRTGVDTTSQACQNNVEDIIGIEVKKLERGSNGKIARATGLDFNSTPPCGKVRIYDGNDRPLVVKAFYLFACLETDPSGKCFVSALTLCDGSILNDDFDLYNSITGSREKGINLGTYGDGANRNRPMLIFSNPLGTPCLDKRISLISQLDLSEERGNIVLTWEFERTDINDVVHHFYVYLDAQDASEEKPALMKNPFPIPQKRVTETQGRGKFKLNVE